MAGRVSAGWCELRLKSEWFGFVVGVASPEHVRGKERPGSVVDLASINLDIYEPLKMESVQAAAIERTPVWLPWQLAASLLFLPLVLCNDILKGSTRPPYLEDQGAGPGLIQQILGYFATPASAASCLGPVDLPKPTSVSAKSRHLRCYRRLSS